MGFQQLTSSCKAWMWIPKRRLYLYVSAEPKKMDIVQSLKRAFLPHWHYELYYTNSTDYWELDQTEKCTCIV